MPLGRGPIRDPMMVGNRGTGPVSRWAARSPVWPAGGLAFASLPDRGPMASQGVTEVLHATFRVRDRRVRQAGPQVFLSTRAEDKRGSPQARQARVRGGVIDPALTPAHRRSGRRRGLGRWRRRKGGIDNAHRDRAGRRTSSKTLAQARSPAERGGAEWRRSAAPWRP